MRLQGRELDLFGEDPDGIPAILATLPVHIPVAVGDDSNPRPVDQVTLTSGPERGVSSSIDAGTPESQTSKDDADPGGPRRRPTGGPPVRPRTGTWSDAPREPFG